MAETLLNAAGLQEGSSPHIGWRTPVAVIAASGLVALCAHIAIPLPFTPVPLSMAPFAVMLIGLVFSPRAAFAALALYLAEGAAGLPVFSPFGPGGIAHLLGPNGGYLLSYPLAAALASILYRFARRNILAALVGACVADMLILMAGAAWIGFLTKARLSIVFAESVTPFLVGDLIKVVVAAACASTFHSFRRSRQG